MEDYYFDTDLLKVDISFDDDVVWIDKNNKKYKIEDMTIEYIENILKCFKNKRDEYDYSNVIKYINELKFKVKILNLEKRIDELERKIK